MEQILNGNWDLIIASCAIVVWGIRLEGKILNHEKEIDSLDKRLTDFDSKILLKLSEIAERLSYIEGSLRRDNNEKRD